MTIIIDGTNGITDVNGSAAAPAITGGDTDTGLYFGTNLLGLSTGGTNALYIDSSQNVGIGTTSPSTNLEISTTSFTPLKLTRQGTAGGSALAFANGNGVLGSIGSDSSNNMLFYAGTGATERMRIDSSGNVGIGTTSPTYKFEVVQPAASGTATFKNTNASYATDVWLDYSQTGQFLLSARSSAENKDVWISNATSTGSMLLMTNGTERMRITSAGNVLVTSSGGLGYGAGSGGTVTQLTSKATAVTINKLSGQIVTSNSALAANGTQSFTVNNSLVTAGDIVVCNWTSGGTIGNYFIRNYGVTTGSFVLNILNTTAGSLSDAIVISFSVIKSSTT